MLFVRTLLGLGVISLVAACSSTERDIPAAVGVPATAAPTTPTNTPDGGANDATAPATDAGPVTDGGGTCLPTATFSLDGAYGGVLAVRGTLTFPAPLPQGRAVTVSFQAEVGGEIRQQTYSTLAISDRFTYRVGGLIPGRYILRVQADATNNGSVTDSGDYDGYFNGTSAGPLLLRADAVAVEVKDVCRDNLDFGAGVKL